MAAHIDITSQERNPQKRLESTPKGKLPFVSLAGKLHQEDHQPRTTALRQMCSQ